MSLDNRTSESSGQFSVWNQMPQNMRLLFISNRQRIGGNLAAAFAMEGGPGISIYEVNDSQEGMTALGQNLYDVVLVSHDPPELDAMVVSRGFRSGGGMDALIIMGTHPQHELLESALTAGADDYVCVQNVTVRELVWRLSRAIQRSSITRENIRLKEDILRHVHREHDELERMLYEQDLMLVEVSACLDRGKKKPSEKNIPNELRIRYAELMRNYIMMSTGNLTHDVQDLAQALTTCDINVTSIMGLHLDSLRNILTHLGTRSTRHVILRADMLRLELLLYITGDSLNRYEELHTALDLLK